MEEAVPVGAIKVAAEYSHLRWEGANMKQRLQVGHIGTIDISSDDRLGARKAFQAGENETARPAIWLKYRRRLNSPAQKQRAYIARQTRRGLKVSELNFCLGSLVGAT